MKFGVREICDVVLKAKTAQKIGNKIFYAGEPVIYFDTLKTSSMEGAATTVYAQGGRGNSRLVAWEGERTVTFTMEDALISPEGFMILSGAGLIDASEDKPVYQHVTETIDAGRIEDDTENNKMAIHVEENPYVPNFKGENFAYVMLMKNGEIISEPFIPVHYGKDFVMTELGKDAEALSVLSADTPVIADPDGGYWMLVESTLGHNNNAITEEEDDLDTHNRYSLSFDGYDFDAVMVDYYTARMSDAQQIEIAADKFGGNYYLEASTLFRDQNGVDMPAEFIIPNCNIQSNFTFTMASSGDPSSFTFTLDAFPDYTRFDKSKKVLAAIQVIRQDKAMNIHRHSTVHEAEHELKF